MTIVEKTDKTIAIPVGIGVVQTETTRNFYNTNDSTITSSDVVVDKVAYGKYGKIIGSFDLYAEKQDSYNNGYAEGNTDGYNSGFSAGNQVGYENGYSEGKDYGYDQGYHTGYENGYEYGENEGYADGYAEGLDDGIVDGVEQQKSKLETITITENGTYNREDGYNKVIVEVPDLNGSYDEGYEDGYSEGNQVGYENGYNEGNTNGIVTGRNEIIEGQSDATITPSKVLKGYIGYGKDNERIVGESEAITSIDVAASGIRFFNNRTFTEMPSYYDFSGNFITCYQLFYGCPNLINVPSINTTNCTDMTEMFYGCAKITSIPLMNTSKVTTMHGIIQNTGVTEFPLLDTSKVTSFEDAFYASKISTLPNINTSKVTSWQWAFSNCSNFTHFPSLSFEAGPNLNYMFYNTNNLEIIDELDFGYMRGGLYNGLNMFASGNFSKLTTLGGFKDLGKSYYNGSNSAAYKDLPLQNLPALTYESCMNVINKVYDMALNTENTYTPKIRFHATPYALLSADDIAIATAKGWIVQAG